MGIENGLIQTQLGHILVAQLWKFEATPSVPPVAKSGSLRFVVGGFPW
jgi:hypothetical protein